MIGMLYKIARVVLFAVAYCALAVVAATLGLMLALIAAIFFGGPNG